MDSLDWARILPDWFFPAWAGLLGLVAGSFANVCIHRLPLGESVVAPRSRCPSCGTPVRALDNIPVLSWLLLRGRCRACRAAISPRYPLVEFAGGLLFLLLAVRFGPGTGFAVLALFVLALLILFHTDFDQFILPDAVTLPGLAAGILLSPWNPLLASADTAGGAQRVIASLTGGAAGAGLVVLILLGWKAWTRGRLGPDATDEERSGMGLGDLKMLALIGAFVGLRQVFFVTFVAALAGSVFGGALLLLGRGGRRTALPFGCFLAVAGVLSVFWGRPVVDAYMRLLGL